MRTEYEVWRDELAGRRRPWASVRQWALYAAGVALLAAATVLHRS